MKAVQASGVMAPIEKTVEREPRRPEPCALSMRMPGMLLFQSCWLSSQLLGAEVMVFPALQMLTGRQYSLVKPARIWLESECWQEERGQSLPARAMKENPLGR